MKIIHIAPNIDYLFPNTMATAKVLCGRLASDVLDSGEFIGLQENWNHKCALCTECAGVINLTLGL